MRKKKADHSFDIGVLLLNLVLTFVILLQALGGLASRNYGFGLILLLASICFNIALSFLFKNKWFLRSFLIFSFLINTFIISESILIDGSSLINRIIIFLVVVAIISSLYVFFTERYIRRSLKVNKFY